MSELLPKSPAPDLEHWLQESFRFCVLPSLKSTPVQQNFLRKLKDSEYVLLNREAAKRPLKMWKVARVAKSQTLKCDGNAHSREDSDYRAEE